MTVTPEAPAYDVERVRADFPALASGVAHFDGPGGSQTPHPVAEAVASAMLSGVANRGTVTDAEQRAETIVRESRAAMADLLGADPGGIVFGRSMTQLTYDLSRVLAGEWQPGDEVVVTRLDHDANVRPWVQVAARHGVAVRWVDPALPSMDLPVDRVAAVLTERTRLVAITGASNLVGTRPDVPAIAAAAHEVGALVYLDAVHLVPHAPVDLGSLGVDLLACSPYKFFGPHLGAVAAAPALFEGLHPDKLLPSSDAVPERFELGTLPYELLAGVTATVDFIADLALAAGPRRERVLRSMAAVEAYEGGLAARLREGLGAIPGVRLHGSAARRTPTVLFTVDGTDPRDVYVALATRLINAPASSFYALEPAQLLGLGAAGGVRAGIAPYTTVGEVDRLVAAVAEIARAAA